MPTITSAESISQNVDDGSHATNISQHPNSISANAGAGQINLNPASAEIGVEYAYLRVRKGDGETGTVTFRGDMVAVEDSGLQPGEFAVMLDAASEDIVLLANIGGVIHRGAVALTPA